VLRPHSTSLPMWKDLPAPLTAKMYLFNVTNADEVESSGAKPEVVEVGPYTFYENHHKTKMVWNDNATITYQQIRTWQFAPELSVGSLSDRVTIVNPVAATIGELVRSKVPKALHAPLNWLLLAEKERLFVTHTANEIIFNGFEDPLLNVLDSLKALLKSLLPDGALMDKFAFFYKRNGSDFMDGVFNMFTGAADVNKMGVVHAWNYSTHNYFPGDCGLVRGGAGEFYPPGLPRTHLEMFSNDLCRSVQFEFKAAGYSQGIPTYEYVSRKSMFANGTDRPEFACYNPTSAYLPSGVFNASLCRFGAPVFISQPHFLFADSYYSSLVKGMQPDLDKHQTHLKVEPESGVPVDVAARFQLNVLIDKVDGISIFEKVPRAFVPVMWFEDSMAVPSNMVMKMKLMASLKDIVGGMGWAIFGLALGTLLILALTLTSRRRGREDTGPILTDSLAEESDNENVFQD